MKLPANSISLDFLSATWAPISSLESHPVSAHGSRPSFGSSILCRYQRLSAVRADQVSSELDKLINVSQFIIRALSSPCQPANGNINHRLPHHDPSHIAAAHPLPTALSSVDSPKYRQRPEHIRLEQMSDAVRKQPQTRLTYRAPSVRRRHLPRVSSTWRSDRVRPFWHEAFVVRGRWWTFITDKCLGQKKRLY